MLTFFGLAGVMYYSNFYLQSVRGYSPLETGALIAPVAVGVVLGAPLSVRLVRHFGIRPVVAPAMLLAVATFFGLVFFTLDTPVVWFCVMMVAQGLGMGAVMAPTTEAIIATLPPERTGAGSAANNSMRQVGSALGVAVLGSVLSAVYRNDVADAVAGLPAGAREAAGNSISGAYGVAAQAGPAGTEIIARANSAFIDAMHYAAIGSIVFALLGALTVFIWLPGKRPANAPAPTSAESLAEEQAVELVDV